MKLTTSGAVQLGNGYTARRTRNDDWYVSMRDKLVGYALDLTEAQTMAEQDRAKRLAKIDAMYTDQRMREAENREPVEG